MTASDAISLIGIVLALQAVTVASFVFYYERFHDNQKKHMEMIANSLFMLECLHKETANVLTETGSIFTFQASLNARLLESQPVEVRKKICRELKHYVDLYDKSLLQFLIFSSKKEERDSALRELAEVYGDVYTLELLGDVRKARRGEDADPALEYAIRSLRKRIDDALKNGRVAEHQI